MEILAIAVVFALAFALLFREAPILFKFELKIKHEYDVPVSQLESMKTSLTKEEEEILKGTGSVLSMLNDMMCGKMPEYMDQEEPKQ